jgi:phosphoglycerate dehydrogenase-like enzyme
MNVVFHYAAGPGLIARLAELSDLTITVCPEADDAKLTALLPETDVLWHVLKPATVAMIAAAPKLRLIQKIGVGVNTIDLETAKARSIAVCNLPGTNARAVAELALTLMLATLRVSQHSTRRWGKAWHLREEAGVAAGIARGSAISPIHARRVTYDLAAGQRRRSLDPADSRRPRLRFPHSAGLLGFGGQPADPGHA